MDRRNPEIQCECPHEGSLMTNEPWVSVDDLARHLGVAKDSIYRWIDHKGLPAHKIGRLWKFKLSEVDDWVRDGGASGDEPPEGGRGRRG
jgi:excisionase family DNA binding protein